jgi:TolB protein
MVLSSVALTLNACGQAPQPTTKVDPHAAAQPASPPAAPLDWKTLEAPVLTHDVQLTSRSDFVKAGEAYFNRDASWVIFQGVPVPAAGKTPDPFYSMYVAKVKRDGAGKISGLGKAILLSPPGSANTCGWFHPQSPHKVMFGSSIVAPATDQKSGFSVGDRKYTWLFPQETEVVERAVLEIFTDMNPAAPPVSWAPDATTCKPIFSRPDYDAECSYSKDGRFILYAHVREKREAGARADADIWIYDTKTKEQHPIVVAEGYDGGPFFSPDDKRICYRSDRKGNDLLQLFVSDLKFENGVPVGVEHEYQLTDNESVNWAPFWDPTGSFLIYGTSEVSHANYEVFAVEASAAKLRSGAKAADLKRVRITQANGADVLPVFTPDGKTMMWTAQRGQMIEGEQKPSSQLWAAEFDAAAMKWGK